ncbi:MAG: hypothetical protein A2289_13345 [Deltaproteobacteria bacterium RIFOXYA12_FULL_58_15]|nr:MAG: hypothetical protein A2289_13345 [Deltaproteobacteria bacterium RIFOXYA12_FULL_58_15]
MQTGVLSEEDAMQRASAADWTKRVERWKDSGLTAKEFAAEMGFKASTLTYWSSKLRRAAGSNGNAQSRVNFAKRWAESPARGSSAPPASAPKLVELPVAQVVSLAPMLELVLQGDVRVRVPADFDEQTLVRLMRVVEQTQ